MVTTEVSILILRTKTGTQYKVTRRIPELHVAETRLFSSRDEARSQFDDWLKYSDPLPQHCA
jgi:hypothetical protein